jgi:type IV secretion system protein VirD4
LPLHLPLGAHSLLPMSGTRILWGQLLFASIVVLAFLWTATEWTAWRLAFQPQLGPAWFTIGRWPIYQPFVFFIWWFKFDAYAPRIFIQGGCIAASGGIAAMGVAIVFSVWRAREARHVTTYGSARWADAREVRRAGLLGPDGVVLGRFGRRYLRHDGPEHVLCFAPTRSGKASASSFRHC